MPDTPREQPAESVDPWHRKDGPEHGSAASGGRKRDTGPALAREGRLIEGRSLELPGLLAYRAQRTRPLLVIHLLDIRNPDAGERSANRAE